MLTLQEAFAQVPDPRGSRGKRYPLPLVWMPYICKKTLKLIHT